MSDLAYTLKVFRRIGLIAPILPHRIIGAGVQLAKWGPGFPSGVHACAARYPNQVAIIDDAGSLTWREMAQQINQLTDVLRERGVGAGDSVALLARNHRYIVMAMVAVMQRGGRVLLLNTMASKSQLGELAKRESATLVMLDEEFLPVAADLPREELLLTWADSDTTEVPVGGRGSSSTVRPLATSRPRSTAASSSSPPAPRDCPRVRDARSPRTSSRWSPTSGPFRSPGTPRSWWPRRCSTPGV